MNKDQVSGKVEQTAGKIKQSVRESDGTEKPAKRGVVDQAIRCGKGN